MIGHVSASQVASELWFLLLWLLLLLLVVVVVLLLLLPRATMTLPGCMSMWTNLRCNGSALGFRQGVVLCLFSSSLFPVTMQCFIYMYVCMYVRACFLRRCGLNIALGHGPTRARTPSPRTLP